MFNSLTKKEKNTEKTDKNYCLVNGFVTRRRFGSRWTGGASVVFVERSRCIFLCDIFFACFHTMLPSDCTHVLAGSRSVQRVFSRRNRRADDVIHYVIETQIYRKAQVLAGVLAPSRAAARLEAYLFHSRQQAPLWGLGHVPRNTENISLRNIFDIIFPVSHVANEKRQVTRNIVTLHCVSKKPDPYYVLK